MYHLLEDEEHASSLPLIGIPEVLPLRASMSSRGALSDKDFRVWIAEWTTLPSRQTIRFSRTGAILLMKPAASVITRKLGALAGNRAAKHPANSGPGETTNQLGWATIRKCAKQAAAKFDDYLEKRMSLNPLHCRYASVRRQLLILPLSRLNPTLRTNLQTGSAVLIRTLRFMIATVFPGER